MVKTKSAKKAKPKFGVVWERVKKKWVKDLRSGKFRQTRGVLMHSKNKKDSFCCLGVLACQFNDMRNKKQREAMLDAGGVTNSGSYLRIPKRVQTVLDQYNYTLEYTYEGFLINLNDDKKRSFKKIADQIERLL